METIYLKHGAENVQGNRLNTRLEYVLIHAGLTHAVIKNNYNKEFYVNNKYVKYKPRPK